MKSSNLRAMKHLFKLRGKLEPKTRLILEILGIIIFILLWALLAYLKREERPTSYNFELSNGITKTIDERTIYKFDFIDGKVQQFDATTPEEVAAIKAIQNSRGGYTVTENVEVQYPIIPTPMQVLKTYSDLFQKDGLLKEIWYSVKLNFMGYGAALLVAIPIGFIIGLIPLFRGLFSRHVDALRFIPLTAVTVLFILWFGIEIKMKVAFLAFGILVYLIPVMVQRIDEVKDVFLKTVFTIGATNWQTIRTVYIPSVLSRVSDDIRVLVAISWTYIIIAEMLNNTGGVGAMIYQVGQKRGRIDKIFAILVIIILIGFLQDKLFILLDRVLFPHKHANKANKY